jgi:alkylation response protein AidB-like acyl-CoA dehydrogenase
MSSPGLTVQGMETIGEDRTNQVFFDNVYVSDEYRVGELNKAFSTSPERSTSSAFTLFTFAPIEKRVELLCEWVRTAVRDGKPLRDDPIVRQRIAWLVTQTEVARVCSGSSSSPSR